MVYYIPAIIYLYTPTLKRGMHQVRGASASLHHARISQHKQTDNLSRVTSSSAYVVPLGNPCNASNYLQLALMHSDGALKYLIGCVRGVGGAIVAVWRRWGHSGSVEPHPPSPSISDTCVVRVAGVAVLLPTVL